MQYADSTAEEALDGFLHKKWIAFFVRQCGLHGILCRDLDKKEILKWLDYKVDRCNTRISMGDFK